MSAPVAPTKEAPANGKAGVASPTPVVPGWYSEPGTDRQRYWDGREYGPNDRQTPAPSARVTRSRRGLYAGLLAAVGLGIVVVVVILATALSGGTPSSQTPASPAPAVTFLPPGTRFDGGPDEGTRGEFGTPRVLAAPGTRFDGGPDEGTRGEFGTPRTLPPGTRFDGGPDEGTRGAGH
jgi:hypothetical protein